MTVAILKVLFSTGKFHDNFICEAQFLERIIARFFSDMHDNTL